jgi:hypothetical protein
VALTKAETIDTVVDHNGYQDENGSTVPARPYSGPKNGSSSHHLIASEM